MGLRQEALSIERGGVVRRAGLERALEASLAHADVQPEHARAIEIGRAVVVVVADGERGEREPPLLAVEEERRLAR
ncbi:MAG: hypothetical protein KF878_20770 [Planctomycetes bacterium]|nr:hypothetical protein [Planctomycetota bacterium]